MVKTHFAHISSISFQLPFLLFPVSCYVFPYLLYALSLSLLHSCPSVFSPRFIICSYQLLVPLGFPYFVSALTDYTVAVLCFQERLLCITVSVCTNKSSQCDLISPTLFLFISMCVHKYSLAFCESH